VKWKMTMDGSLPNTWSFTHCQDNLQSVFCTLITIHVYMTTHLYSAISVFVVNAILMLISEILHTHTYKTLVTVFTLDTCVTLISTQVGKTVHSKSKIFVFQ